MVDVERHLADEPFVPDFIDVDPEMSTSKECIVDCLGKKDVFCREFYDYDKGTCCVAGDVACQR